MSIDPERTKRARRCRVRVLFALLLVLLATSCELSMPQLPVGHAAEKSGKLVTASPAKTPSDVPEEPVAPTTTATTEAPATTEVSAGAAMTEASAPEQPIGTTSSGSRSRTTKSATAPTTSTPSPATTSPPPGSSTPGPHVDVRSFGARGDGVTDDTAAMQRAIDSLGGGGTVLFPAGTYVQSNLLVVAPNGVWLDGRDGATIHATNPNRQAVLLRGDRTGVANLRFTTTARARLGTLENQRVVLDRSSGARVRDSEVIGSAAGGIFAFGATDYAITGNTVQATMADGIHNTFGSRNGTITGNSVIGVGDDCIAVVSYLGDGAVSRDIRIQGNRCVDGEARGIAVVGGEQVTISGNRIDHSRAAAVYLASEESWSTYPARGVTVTGNEITRANFDPAIYHGAIFVYGQATGLPVSDILIQGNVVRDTLQGGAHVTVKNQFVQRIRIIDNRLFGASVGGINIEAPSVEIVVTGNTHNGWPTE